MSLGEYIPSPMIGVEGLGGPAGAGPDGLGEYYEEDGPPGPGAPMEGVGQAPPRRPGVWPTVQAPLPSLLAARGMGQNGENGGAKIGLGVGLVVIAVFGVASYVAGRAMAPPGRSKTAYGIGGTVAGLFLGPLGLGIVGAVSLSQRK